MVKNIGVFGRRNVGKSSFVNTFAGQDVSIVSPVAGTTTDPVRKRIEISGVGICNIIDTAGMDDLFHIFHTRLAIIIKCFVFCEQNRRNHKR